MLTKEPGYDEFLAEKIRKGKKDIETGRVYTAEQSRAMARKAIERKLAELEEYKQRECYA